MVGRGTHHAARRLLVPRGLVGVLGLAMEDLVVTLGTSGSFEDAFLTPDKWAETIETISRIATAEARGLAEKHDDVT